MGSNKACLYRGNGTKDEGTLCSKRLATKGMTCTPMTLMTLGQPVYLCAFLRRQVESSLHGSHLWSEGAIEEYKIRDDGSRPNGTRLWMVSISTQTDLGFMDTRWTDPKATWHPHDLSGLQGILNGTTCAS